MKPIKFREHNSMLTKPSNMTDKECGPLQVFKTYSGGQTHGNEDRIISCWKMSLIDRIRAVLFGKIWVDVHARFTHPPLALDCRKTIFVKKGPWGWIKTRLQDRWKTH